MNDPLSRLEKELMRGLNKDKAQRRCPQCNRLWYHYAVAMSTADGREIEKCICGHLHGRQKHNTPPF